ncbi:MULTISPECIES: hypothetical protein [unclassified Streptomyces]|uniref:hypothetical protein n=1 Tax=unclassified Streptomyces TaxID=2593676 RepID=UPI002E2DCDE1|nr:hypothetical protein [Streptomyces sp. NBC_01439]
MSDLPHADYIAAVHAALAAEGLRVRSTWTTELTHRASDLHITSYDDADGGFRFEDGEFHGERWSEPDWVWLGWEHHQGWWLMDEDSALLPIAYDHNPLPLSELFADPTAVAAAVRQWLTGPSLGTPVLSGRWSRADASEAALRTWHERRGRCLDDQDRHLRRDDEGERVSNCRCPYQPCGAVALRDFREDCSWHIVPRDLSWGLWSSHSPESCPGLAAGT